MAHVEPSGETMPIKSAVTGEVVAPAVVASGTMMSAPAATGSALLNEMAEAGAGAGRTMREMGFESAPGVPGFCICNESTPGEARSEGCRETAH